MIQGVEGIHGCGSVFDPNPITPVGCRGITVTIGIVAFIVIKNGGKHDGLSRRTPCFQPSVHIERSAAETIGLRELDHDTGVDGNMAAIVDGQIRQQDIGDVVVTGYVALPYGTVQTNRTTNQSECIPAHVGMGDVGDDRIGCAGKVNRCILYIDQLQVVKHRIGRPVAEDGVLQVLELAVGDNGICINYGQGRLSYPNSGVAGTEALVVDGGVLDTAIIHQTGTAWQEEDTTPVSDNR